MQLDDAPRRRVCCAPRLAPPSPAATRPHVSRAQPLARSTAARQSRCAFSSRRPGVKVRSMRRESASSSREPQTPEPSPARKAAPSPVVSTPGRSTGTPAGRPGAGREGRWHGTAVDGQRGEATATFGNHEVDHVAHLEGDRIEGRPGQVGGRRSPGDADDDAAGGRIPVGRAEPGQRRHEHTPPASGTDCGQAFDLGGVLDDSEPVAQPLDGRAGDEDRSFEGVRQRAVGSAHGHGGEQPLAWESTACRAGVDQHEGAGAVGALRIARRRSRTGRRARPAGRRRCP